MTMRGKMVHKFSDRADEQRKEAEVVRLRTGGDGATYGVDRSTMAISRAPPRNIWIDLMTGQFCDPEPIERGGQVIPFTAPRSGLRGKGKYGRDGA
jgi:hypothetical protein